MSIRVNPAVRVKSSSSMDRQMFIVSLKKFLFCNGDNQLLM